MLSAPKEQQRLAAATSKPSGASIDSFVTSIEALQQRLEWLSLDELTAVENRTKTLEIGLLELQSTLDAISKVKRSVVAVAEAIEQITLPSLDSIEFDLASRPFHLHHLLAPSSKLIPFPQPVKVQREQSKDPSAGVDGKTSSPAFSNRRLPEPLSRPSTAEHTRLEGDLVSSARGQDFAETPAAPSAAKGSEPENLASQIKGSEQPAAISAAPTSASSEIPDANKPDTAPTPSNDGRSHDVDAPEFPRQDEVPTDEFQFTAERIVRTSPSHDDEVFATAAPEAAPATDHPQVDFDQRLLDDLIKNYGEFTVSPNVSAGIKPTTVADNERKYPTAAPVGHTGPQVSRKSTLPVNKKDAELDRQLKQIIKDYGEYDLYSQPTPINLKKGVLVAIFLLVVLFFGFYLFSAPSPTPTARQEPLNAKVGADTPDKATGSSAPTEPKSPSEK